MRVLLALALLVFALAGIDTASARAVRHHWAHHAIAFHVSPLVIYQYEPGVMVRAYWRAPWRNRHYYPTTGTKPEVGRDEDLSATGSAPEPAESFHRTWSSSSAFMQEQPRASLRAIDQAPPPDAQPNAGNSDRNPDAVKP
jgi:hypothetical protein